MKITIATFRLSALVVLILGSASCATTRSGEAMTITGKIVVGSLDSLVQADNGFSVGFLTDSREGKIIFASCGLGDLCQVSGTVRGTGIDAFFDHVARAALVHQGE